MYSTAKLMTALLVLRDHPVPPGEPGPVLTVSPADAALTAEEAASGASVVPVQAGEQLTEEQLLEGLLIPSGNNFAEMLAAWDAGSVQAFVAAMNTEADALHLGSTRFADPAGFDEQTVSVPVDLIALERAALRDPLIGDIVGMPQATLPVAGTVYNVDYALGRHGIAGAKTGSSPQGTASFAGLALTAVAGRQAVVYTAVMGQADLDQAFGATESLIDAVTSGLVAWTPAGTASDAARYDAPWGGGVEVRGANDLTVLAWPGWSARTRYRLRALEPPQPAGTEAGTLTLALGERTFVLELVTVEGLAPPGKRWRLTRPWAGT
jgi:D-alanyl-D-alanine carboxypeptidase (penicillin-binding protein 5/6)